MRRVAQVQLVAASASSLPFAVARAQGPVTTVNPPGAVPTTGMPPMPAGSIAPIPAPTAVGSMLGAPAAVGSIVSPMPSTTATMASAGTSSPPPEQKNSASLSVYDLQ